MWEADEPHSQRLCQVKSLSPHHRFVIALHSPDRVTETGLRLCPPEKGQQIEAIRSRSVRSLQSALRTKYCEIRACFAYFGAKGGAVSLQVRLAGGEGGIRTLGTGVSPYNGLAIHRPVLKRYENFVLYSSFQQVTNQSI